MWSCFPSPRDPVWRIRLGLIGLISRRTPESWACSFLSCEISSIHGRVASAIAFIGVSLVAVCNATGSVTPCTPLLLRSVQALAAHPGQVEIQPAGQFLHATLHRGRGLFVGGLQSFQGGRFAGLLAIAEQ